MQLTRSHSAQQSDKYLKSVWKSGTQRTCTKVVKNQEARLLPEKMRVAGSKLLGRENTNNQQRPRGFFLVEERRCFYEGRLGSVSGQSSSCGKRIVYSYPAPSFQ